MRTILLALMLGFISFTSSPVVAGEKAQDAPAVSAKACADRGCCRAGRALENTVRFVLLAPVRVIQAGACVVQNTACAVKTATCNARARARSRAACWQARRAKFFSRKCCN